ncbi:olfactory receptor 6B2-like [Bufo bufo]|uniref:olfactory receptor 6B2-like n=1 Tax=Bufo bufo TaxID=8384 RepID=UPI001ABE4BC0|nr:olfactory receptor 6B2-like [Bufo bufo]
MSTSRASSYRTRSEESRSSKSSIKEMAALVCAEAEAAKEKNMTTVTEFFIVGFQSSGHLRIDLICLILMIYCGTVCGNLLIITLVSTSKNLHAPMYFFISQLSICDILLTTDTTPSMLHILLNNGGTIPFINCMTQLYVFAVTEASECLLLTVMSYDRYVAICNPLRYTSIMTNNHCLILAILCWVIGSSCSFIEILTTSMLTFCGPNVIDHLFCDLMPLIEIACSGTSTIDIVKYILSFPVLLIPITIIIISYINIIVTILRFPSNISRQKAFSTCSSHLIVVTIFFFTILIVYIFPKGEQTSNSNKLVSLIYTVFTPFINPIIYSLRNKEIKKSVQEITNKYKICGYKIYI